MDRLTSAVPCNASHITWHPKGYQCLNCGQTATHSWEIKHLRKMNCTICGKAIPEIAEDGLPSDVFAVSEMGIRAQPYPLSEADTNQKWACYDCFIEAAYTWRV